MVAENNLKPLVRAHNFKSYPESGLILLVKIEFNDESVKHSILRRGYFCEEVLDEQKNNLEELKNLPKEFSSQIKEIRILDEKLEIRVEGKGIKIFKNYSESIIGTVAEENNLEILKTNFSKIFPEYTVTIVRDGDTEISQAASRLL